MKKQKAHELFVTGIGVTSAVGQGKEAFFSALMNGRHAFAHLKRKGRQKETAFLGAEIDSFTLPAFITKRVIRTASLTGQVALTTLHEAWMDADLDGTDTHRIGLIIGGSNVQQRELLETYEQYHHRVPFVRPTYALSHMDTDLCGLCTEQFGIHGLAFTLGGASASGQLAILQAAQAVQVGSVDICIALGALMDPSYLEFQAFRSIGAMGTDRYADDPARACRPYDKNRDGFIFGEACGAVIIERADSALRRGAKPYAKLSGWAMCMDGNRNPDPSYEGEVRVIEGVLEQARLSPSQIDYINPHGTGSEIGDRTEIKAIRDCRLSHAFINATKSITGHGLSAAGAVEAVATILQMKESRLHPTLNLETPIDDSLKWVKHQPVTSGIAHALNLSMGFGGINTAICLSKHETD